MSERNALELARKALESERKARSEADREVLMLQGRVMGIEKASAWLCEQVARQAEEFSTLENFHLGTYPFVFHRVGFFLQSVSELVALLPELGGKVKSLEQDLETVMVTFGQNVEELAKSREE